MKIGKKIEENIRNSTAFPLYKTKTVPSIFPPE